MSQRKEVIRVDAGISGRLAKQSRLRAQARNVKPVARGGWWIAGAGVLLLGCIAMALCALVVNVTSKNRAVTETQGGVPLKPVIQPAALEVTCSPVSNAGVALQPPASPQRLPAKRALAEPEREKGPTGKETHASLFGRLDVNRDGCVTSAEYGALARNKQKHRGQILALDKDKDGRITEKEFCGVKMAQLVKWLDVQD